MLREKEQKTQWMRSCSSSMHLGSKSNEEKHSMKRPHKIRVCPTPFLFYIFNGSINSEQAFFEEKKQSDQPSFRGKSTKLAWLRQNGIAPTVEWNGSVNTIKTGPRQKKKMKMKVYHYSVLEEKVQIQMRIWTSFQTFSKITWSVRDFMVMRW